MKKIIRLFILLTSFVLLISCNENTNNTSETTISQVKKQSFYSIDYESLNFIKEERDILLSLDEIKKIENDYYENVILNSNSFHENEKKLLKDGVILSNYYGDVGNYRYCLIYLAYPIAINSLIQLMGLNNDVTLKDLLEMKKYCPYSDYLRVEGFSLAMIYGYCPNYIRIFVNKDTGEIETDYPITPTADELRMIALKNSRDFKELYEKFKIYYKPNTLEEYLEECKTTDQAINSMERIEVNCLAGYDLYDYLSCDDVRIDFYKSRKYDYYYITPNGNTTLYEILNKCYSNENIFVYLSDILEIDDDLWVIEIPSVKLK